MASHSSAFVSEEEYLQLDEKAERASEYRNGVMLPIEDVTPNHSLISINLATAISLAMRKRPKGSCFLYSQPLRVHIPKHRYYAQPDLMFACDPVFEKPNTLINPAFIIEILSSATADYDRGGKFLSYRSIPSLLEYVTVAQEEVHIEHWVRVNGFWTLIHEHQNLADRLVLHNDLEVIAADVYANVDWLLAAE